MAKITLEDLQQEGAFKTPAELQEEMLKQEPEKTEEAVEETPEEVKEDEPVVTETVAEEPKEDVKEEPKAEEVKEEEPKKEETEEKEPSEQFNIAFLNEQLKKNYESLDEVKADLDKPTMESEYEEAKTQIGDLQAKITELEETQRLLVEQTDPSTYFSSNDAMKAEVFKKQNPKKDASIIEKVFSTEDLSSIDDLEVVKMGWKFKSSKSLGADAKIEAAIKEELNVDPDAPISEMSETAQVRLAKMADEYRDAFDHMKKSVDLPERIDLEKLKTQSKEADEERASTLKEGWGKVAEESLKSTTKIEVPIGTPKEGEEQAFFQWDLGDAPTEDVEKLKEDYIDLGLDPDSEAKELFQKSLELRLLDKNLPQIMQKYGDDLLARQEKEHLEKTHNTEPLKDAQRSEESDADKLKKERSSFALGGIGPVVHGHPLFTTKK